MRKILLSAAFLAALAACAKPAVQASASDQAASSAAPVKWDYASNDPAKNPNAANRQEASAAGYNP